jgi:hypothetical protein
VLDRPSETDGYLVIGVGELPRVAGIQPLVGALQLPAILERLLEDPELVVDAVCYGWQIERRQRVHEAGGQPPQAAVAQGWLGLQSDQRVQVEAQVGQRLARQLGRPGI